LAAERTEKDLEEERGTRRWAAEGAAVAGGGQRRGEILIVVVAQPEFFLPTGIFIPRRSGKGIPFLTVRIQIPNQNRMYKRYRAVYRGINSLYCCSKGFYRAVNNLYWCTEKDSPA
jgi:hypothetical protein